MRGRAPRAALVRTTLFAAAGALATGCTATVLHDHFLGPERRLTIEWTDEAPWPAKPAALLGGVVCDGAIGAASTALWPVDWVGTAGMAGWQCWQEDCDGAWWAAPVFPLVSVVALPVAPILEAHRLGPAWRWFPPRTDAAPLPADPAPPRPRPDPSAPGGAGASAPDERATPDPHHPRRDLPLDSPAE